MFDIIISVIIPCHNGFNLMTRCLDCFERQTDKRFELIIVDDFSNDDSYNNLKQYCNNSNLNISVFRNHKNLGPGASRERGIKEAKGKWISFCDCDDWYELDYISAMVNEILKNNADVILYDYNVCINNKVHPIEYLKNLKIDDKKNYIAIAKESLWCLSVKKEIIDNLEFPPLFHSEDAAIVPVIISRANKVITIDKVYYNYYFRPESASNHFDRKAYDSTLIAYEYVKSNLDSIYPIESEYIGIKMLMYIATLNGIKSGVEICEIKSMISEFKKYHPHLLENKYLSELGFVKRCYIKVVYYNLYVVAKVFAKIHEKYFQ